MSEGFRKRRFWSASRGARRPRGWTVYRGKEPIEPYGWMREPRGSKHDAPDPQQSENSAFIGAVAMLVGLIVLLPASGLVPAPDDLFAAPRWLVCIGGATILIGGLTLMLSGATWRSDDALERMREPIMIAQGLAVLCVYAMLATFLSWMALDGVSWRAAQGDVLAGFVNDILDRDHVHSVILIALLWVIALASCALAWRRFAPRG